MITLLAFKSYGKQKDGYKLGRENALMLGLILGKHGIASSKLTWSYGYLKFTENAAVVAKGKVVLVGVSDAILSDLEDQWRRGHSTIDIYLYRNNLWWRVPGKDHDYTVAREDDYGAIVVRKTFRRPYEIVSAMSFLGVTQGEVQIISQTPQDDAVIRMANLIRSKFSEAQQARLVKLLASCDVAS